MPLLVNCPNGCQIRVPTNRAGRIVRCSQCKSAIRIAGFDRPFVDEGQVVEVPARLARKRETANIDDVEEAKNGQQPVEPVAVESELPIDSSAATNSPALEALKEFEIPDVVPSVEELQQLDPEIRKAVQNPPRVPPVLQTRPWRQVEPLTDLESSTEVSAIQVTG